MDRSKCALLCLRFRDDCCVTQHTNGHTVDTSSGPPHEPNVMAIYVQQLCAGKKMPATRVNVRNQAEAEVIHEDNANELGEVRAAMAAIRAVMQGYGGGRGIHAAMAGVQCTVCVQEFTGPQGNRVPKLLLCGHTFCSRCIANLTEWNCARCPS
ncbi:hypothetical protein GCK72_015490 [Caenorhabditis remanei]|uniref:RING-type domain-containing protein n=1 Tax=Caenorhabditis remanei TaxID=31234 RepID=A0A6A5GU74_CAERE|nr:hypothetical protein GCK72_015490 [Caenorhabditis remanei]KAF1759030.1 hypothetical protein GCK72_015490 [Caenorhabditis remanei]